MIPRFEMPVGRKGNDYPGPQGRSIRTRYAVNASVLGVHDPETGTRASVADNEMGVPVGADLVENGRKRQVFQGSRFFLCRYIVFQSVGRGFQMQGCGAFPYSLHRNAVRLCAAYLPDVLQRKAQSEPCGNRRQAGRSAITDVMLFNSGYFSHGLFP